MAGFARAVRVDRVADTIAQIEVDCALALTAFSDGNVLMVVRHLRVARGRLNRAIVTLNSGGAR